MLVQVLRRIIFLVLIAGSMLALVAAQNTTIRQLTDLPYLDTGQVEHLLDVYLPVDNAGFPTIMYITGGIWESETKQYARDIGLLYAEQGIAVVVPNRSPNSVGGLETNADEIAAAIAWVLANIADYGGDPEQVIVSGLSAGTRPMALASLNPDYLARYGYHPSDIAGLIIMGGLLEVEPNHANLSMIPNRLPATVAYYSPATYINETTPPLLFINGSDEVDSILDFTREFADAANAMGRYAEWHLVGGNHVAVRNTIGRADDETTPLIAAWMTAIGIENQLFTHSQPNGE